jgi:isopropylmalate/homocitrate/citramalate synthase
MPHAFPRATSEVIIGRIPDKEDIMLPDGPQGGMWPSPFNESSRKKLAPGRRILLTDCTLRDGEQQAGVAFDRAGKLRIARALDELNIYEIEAGTPASSEEDREAIGEMCRLGLRAKISVLCRALSADIDQAMSLGAWGVRVSFPISLIERKHKLKGISDDEYLKRALDIAEHAQRKGAYVIFSPYDTTRAELPFLRRVAGALEKAGTVNRLRVVDTTGCALPDAITYVIGQIREMAPTLPLEIHCHNDLGLACANTLAGIVAGADFGSTTINGLGERCGNAATEEVAMALEVLYGVRTGLDLTKLTAISRLVAELSRVPTHEHKAVVGENTFRHEAGMVVAGLLQDPFTAEPYAPELVGQRRRILIGKKSGLVSISYKVKEMGLPISEERFPEVLTRVKQAAVDKHGALTDEEFKALVEGMLHR